MFVSMGGKNAVPWHLTEQYCMVKSFIIIPLSPFYNVWTGFMFFSISYFVFMVPY